MIATIEGRKSLDIPATLEEYSNMAGNTPSDYVLSGCDTTSVLCKTVLPTSPPGCHETWHFSYLHCGI